MLKHFTQGDESDLELYSTVGQWALSAEIADEIGIPVTGAVGDHWIVLLKSGRPVGFTQLRPMKASHAHMRYLYAESLPDTLTLGYEALKHAEAMGVQFVYANERKDSPIMKSLDFKKTREHERSNYARWEKAIK